jgi:hypothetical protein
MPKQYQRDEAHIINLWSGPAHLMSDLEYFKNGRSPSRVVDEHGGDQMLDPGGVYRILGEGVLGVDNRQRAVLLEGRGVITQLIQQDSQSPNIYVNINLGPCFVIMRLHTTWEADWPA